MAKGMREEAAEEKRYGKVYLEGRMEYVTSVFLKSDRCTRALNLSIAMMLLDQLPMLQRVSCHVGRHTGDRFAMHIYSRTVR